MSLFSLDDEKAKAIASSAGTPCFAYRASVARAGFLRLRAALPPRVRLAYAVKANPHPSLLSLFAGLGASFDCASSGELERVAALGLGGPRILFAGPGKTDAELALALTLGARVEADGIEDLLALEKLVESGAPRSAGAGRAGPRKPGPLAVSLRVHPAAGVEEGSRIIGGTGPSVFGVDEEDLPAFLREARALRHVEIRGLQVFAASNERSAARLLDNHRSALAVARTVEKALASPLDLIDLGGGLGIPYSEAEEGLDVEALGSGLARLLEEADWFGGELLLEPGRWLAGPCGVYLARVLRSKESRGTSFVILEGGLNHLLRPALTGQPFPARAVGKAGALGDRVLAGPLCSSLDRLGAARLPALARGDLVMLGQAGAYGKTEAMELFLSHPAAKEIWIE